MSNGGKMRMNIAQPFLEFLPNGAEVAGSHCRAIATAVGREM
jgi:hypothetical protein